MRVIRQVGEVQFRRVTRYIYGALCVCLGSSGYSAILVVAQGIQPFLWAERSHNCAKYVYIPAGYVAQGIQLFLWAERSHICAKYVYSCWKFMAHLLITYAWQSGSAAFLCLCKYQRVWDQHEYLFSIEVACQFACCY